MSVKLQTEHNLEFLSLKGGFTGSSESALVEMPHCWKSRVTAHIITFSDPNIAHASISSSVAYNKKETNV